ncbi:LysR family transcriptional regulator [Paenibacillus sp. UNC499MF]|uniref:LysR family transcriptional regulator n=1 Tax=Paenibacillus sp. UNC499MF TaxID=1502751 RepID=UPI00089FE7CF|nr:LysR family transcriptional regulator [Paenibacillus sp. UNC499MF]SEG28815.1 transcriptional regulator, LysR family [Paenibacillus sp. UNC499MF]
MIVDHLRVFAAVAEQRHFSRAAEALNISQPGVSQHIRNLEQEFGAKLMIRSPKQVKLTEAGELLYARAKKILRLYEEARQEIDALQHVVTGSLKIGASFTIGEYILPRLLADYAKHYPKVDIHSTIANTVEVVQGVRRDHFHIGLIEGAADAPDVEIEPFMEDEMILIAPRDHPLTREPFKLHALQNQTWVWREPGSGTRDYSDRLIAEWQLGVKRSFMFSSSQSVKEAVSAGLGIAILSRWIVRKELESGEIVHLGADGRRLTRTLTMVRRAAGENSKALEIFVQKVRDAHESMQLPGSSGS